MPRRRPKPPRLCSVKGCGQMIDPWKRLCASCWRQLPFDQRQAIAAAGQARAVHVVADLSIKAAAWVAQRREARAADAARQLAERMGERD